MINSFDDYLQNHLEHEDDNLAEIFEQQEAKEQAAHDMYDQLRDMEVI